METMARAERSLRDGTPRTGVAAAPWTVRAHLAAVGTYLPQRVRTSEEIEWLVARASDSYVPVAGIVEMMTGIRTRHVASDDEQCSDLAAHAARNALHGAGLCTDDVDLLIFAS